MWAWLGVWLPVPDLGSEKLATMMKVLEFPSGTADGESQCADIFVIDDSEDEEESFSMVAY